MSKESISGNPRNVISDVPDDGVLFRVKPRFARSELVGSVPPSLIPSSLDAATSVSPDGNSDEEEAAFAVATLSLVFLGYLGISVVTVFWNAAIIASAYERLTSGTNPSFSFEPNETTAKIIWKYLSSSNLLGSFKQIEITEAETEQEFSGCSRTTRIC